LYASISQKPSSRQSKRKRTLQKVSEEDIMAVSLTTGKTGWALVPTADSDAKRD
jgi:hypothetical protein